MMQMRKMVSNSNAVLLLVLLVLSLAGCQQESAGTSSAGSSASHGVDDVKDKVLKHLKDKVDSSAVVDFPFVDGWSNPDKRPLPRNGLSVAYNHKSGMTATVYQYSGGLASVPDDIQSGAVLDEFANSRAGLKQAVEAGVYDDLVLEDEDIVSLGDSAVKTHWASYLVQREGASIATEIFVWTHKNQFFKLRLSTSPKRTEADKASLGELFTAIGEATSS